MSQPEIAKLAGIQRSGVARFEEGKTWPRNPDRMVKAYATATGYEDSRGLWRIAIGLWERYGEDVLLEGDEDAPPDLVSALDDYLERKFGGEAAGVQGPSALQEKAAG